MRGLLTLLLPALLITGGCAVNPVTGERQLSLISTAQELNLGAAEYQRAVQQQGGEYLADPAVGRYVQEVGQRLAAVSHQPDLPYEFAVINSDTPNAWALPGGKIAINRGLLVLLEDEAQLAAVLGHEIVHVTARHGAQGMSRSILVELGAGVAGLAAGEAGDLVASGVRTGGSMLVAKYSRDQELEADLYGTRYMSAANYDPGAAAELQAILMRLAQGRQPDLLTSLFASHPPSYQRLEQNRQTAASLPGSQRHPERFRQQMARLNQSRPAYQIAANAQKQLADQPQQALQLIEQALKTEPRESRFHELRADALMQLGKNTAAMAAYDQAVRLNPGFFSPWLARGLANFRLQRPEQAEKDLLEANRRLATRIATFVLGELALQQGRQQQAAEYYQAVASADDQLGQQARERLRAMGRN